jgi:uncharacterized protein involved in tolerance to divalent cations
MRHNDTRWLNSYMGEFCLGMLSYTPSVLARIEAVTADKNQPKKIKHVYMWKGQLRSIAEIAQLEGVSQKLITSRISGGWSLERAVTSRLQSETSKRYWWKDRFYTLSEIAKATGRDYNLLYNRVCCNGWSIERAVDTPTGASGKRIRP